MRMDSMRMDSMRMDSMRMDPMPELSLDPIRQAVNTGEFPRALILWNAYAACFAEAMKQGKVTLGQWRETGEFVAWARLVALSTRAYAQDQLNSLHVTARYDEPAPPPRPRILQASL